MLHRKTIVILNMVFVSSVWSGSFPNLSRAQRCLEALGMVVQSNTRAVVDAGEFWLQGIPLSLQSKLVARKNHEALFDTFFSINDSDLDVTSRPMVSRVKEELWAQYENQNDSRKLLNALGNLRGFTLSEGMIFPLGISETAKSHLYRSEARSIRHFLDRAKVNRFYELSVSLRNEFLDLLQSSSLVSRRTLASFIRGLYTIPVYGSDLGWHLSGQPKPPESIANPERWIKEHVPEFSSPKVFLDRPSMTLRPVDKTDFDAVIVGSGPAGSVLAHELTQAGQKVLLLEQGPLPAPGALNTRFLGILQDNGGTRRSLDNTVSFVNARTAGGGATINADWVVQPTHESIASQINHWKSQGWVSPDMYKDSVIEDANRWALEIMGTRQMNDDELNENNRILFEGSKKRGRRPEYFHSNTYPSGTSPSPVSSKKTPIEKLLFPAMQHSTNPLTFVPGAEVLRVEMKKNAVGVEQATGVEFIIKQTELNHRVDFLRDPQRLNLPDNVVIRVNAKKIIVASGAMGSAKLLLKSGIVNDSIGRGLVLHPYMPLIGRFDRSIRGWEKTWGSIFDLTNSRQSKYAIEASWSDPATISYLIPKRGKDLVNDIRDLDKMAGFGVMLIDSPRPENRLTLNSHSEVQLEYKLSGDDINNFTKGIVEGVNILFDQGATEVIVPTYEDLLGPGSGSKGVIRVTSKSQLNLIEKNLKFVPGKTFLSSAHLQSSAKMGPDPGTSVVGLNSEVHGVRGLYVAGAAVHPESVGANPMQAILAFSKILADRLKKGN